METEERTRKAVKARKSREKSKSKGDRREKELSKGSRMGGRKPFFQISSSQAY